MTHDKNNTRIEIIVKRKLALRRIQICFLQKKRERERENKKTICIMRDQTHKATKCIVVYAGLGKYPAPGREKIKGSRTEKISPKA